MGGGGGGGGRDGWLPPGCKLNILDHFILMMSLYVSFCICSDILM